MDYPSIIVHTPGLDGSRRVTAGDKTLGIAYHLDDVVEILRLADVDLDEIEVDESDIIDWQGGGPDDWPGLSEHPAG
ncbi:MULTISPECIES: hypothetical protein [unclassified Streptomyces]|uniref:hypothetical protein n=1 Tax=unclassified Streptomyces TaxID=2593676 RepID=UPI002E8061CC|nr:hypothetical protein [Streptomyces sp. NBC_00589]WTI35237.1 hypothetical protein OIC96_09705 [Streptomyces sp. NBC_00775]WUB31089.1 hypothetical protein OHA51_40025 [Streptomyces sp. NBC_00589]